MCLLAGHDQRCVQDDKWRHLKRKNMFMFFLFEPDEPAHRSITQPPPLPEKVHCPCHQPSQMGMAEGPRQGLISPRFPKEFTKGLPSSSWANGRSPAWSVSTFGSSFYGWEVFDKINKLYPHRFGLHETTPQLVLHWGPWKGFIKMSSLSDAHMIVLWVHGIGTRELDTVERVPFLFPSVP